MTSKSHLPKDDAQRPAGSGHSARGAASSGHGSTKIRLAPGTLSSASPSEPSENSTPPAKAEPPRTAQSSGKSIPADALSAGVPAGATMPRDPLPSVPHSLQSPEPPHSAAHAHRPGLASESPLSPSLPSSAGGSEDLLSDKTVISVKPQGRPSSHGTRTVAMPVGLQGTQLAHFELREYVGGGGMGAVYRGHDNKLGRAVAVKVLARDSATDTELVRRFQNEARSAARLDHENIARVYDFGEAAGWHYIVFEFVEGQNLRDFVQQQGPLPVSDALLYVQQIALALHHAAEREVVHRDIKPSNLVLTQSGRVKLVDMGLARLHQVNSTHEDLTASGVTLGTFDYISPEQARDPRTADVRSDIYSLGCTLYYLLTGSPPFPHGSALQKLLSHTNDPTPDPRDLRPDIPSEAVTLLQRMMAKDPAIRYQDPREIIAEIAAICERFGWDSLHSFPTLIIHSSERAISFWERQLVWIAPLVGLLLAVGGWEVYSRSQRTGDLQLPTFVSPDFPSPSVSPSPDTSSATAANGPRDTSANASRAAGTSDQVDSRTLPGPVSDSPLSNSPSGDRLSGSSSTANPAGNRSDTRPNPADRSEGGVLPSPNRQIVGSQASERPPADNSGSGPSGGYAAEGPNTVGGRNQVGSASSDPGRVAGPADARGSGRETNSLSGDVTTSNAGGFNGGRSAAGGSAGSGLNGNERPGPGGEFATNNRTTNNDRASGGNAANLAGNGRPNEFANPRSGSPAGSGEASAATSPLSPTDSVLVDPYFDARASASSGRQVVSRLETALSIAAQNPRIKRIELFYNGRLRVDPATISSPELEIVASSGCSPVILFQPDPDSMPVSETLWKLDRCQLRLRDVHVEMVLPRDSFVPWALFRVPPQSEVSLANSTVTVRTALTGSGVAPDITVFDIQATAGDRGTVGYTAARIESPIRLTMNNCIVRGPVSLLRASESTPLTLTWVDGLLATNDRLASLGGSSRTHSADSLVNIRLAHITALLQKGLCLLTNNERYPNLVPVNVQCDDSILVLRVGSNLFDQRGTASVARFQNQLRYTGNRNFYEGVSTFWRISSMSEPEREWDAATWKSFWQGAENTPRFDLVEWMQPPPWQLPTELHAPADYRLRDNFSNPAIRSAADFRNAGFRDSLPVLPSDSNLEFGTQQN